MRIFSCFRGKALRPDADIRLTSSVDQVVDLASQRKDADQGALEAVEAIQAALLGLSGTWLGRVHALSELFNDHGLVAEIYGIMDIRTCENVDFVRLSPGLLAEDAASERADALLQMVAVQAPLATQLQSNPGERSSQPCQRHHQRHPRRAAAVPLRQGEKLIGALWLEEPHHATQLLQVQDQVQESTGSVSDKQGSVAARAMNPSATARQRLPGAGLPAPASASLLLRNNEALRQVAFTASMCLAGLGGPDSLPWLTSVVSRLRAASSMQSLTTQLCTALSYHVRSRFVLDASTCAALVPPGSGTASGSGSQGPQLALLIRVQPGAAGEAAGALGTRPGGAGEAVGGAEGDMSGSVLGTSEGCVSKRKLLGARGGMPSGGAAVAGSSINTAPSTSSAFRAANAEEGAIAARSVSRLLGGITAPLTSQLVSGSRAPAANSGHIVVPLSAADIATVTSSASAPPALHASAFPLHHTLLQTVLQKQTSAAAAGGAQGRREPSRGSARRQVGSLGAGAEGSGSVKAVEAAAPVVEDTMLFVQNVHNPSRDVCLLMGSKGLTLSGMLGAGAGGTSGGNSGASPFYGGAIGGSGGGAVAGLASTAPQSLVLVTVLLDEGAALGLYVCFPRRLPGQLLEAVRSSCQELVDLVLAEMIRDKLRGSLAAEYITLQTMAPGSYAVVRGVDTANERTSQSGARGAATAAGLITNASGGCLETLYRRKSAMTGTHVSGMVSSNMFNSDLVNTGETATTPTHTQQQALQQSGPPTLESRRFDWTAARRSFSIARRGSVSMDRGAGGGAATARSLGDRTAPSTATVAATIAAAAVGPPADDLLDILLASSNGDINPAASLPDLRAPNTSIITVTGVEAGGATARQQMDLLVNSIQATMQVATAAAGAGGTCAFASDLDQLELLEVLGRGGGGVVLKGMLGGTLPVAVKLMEMPDEDADESDSRPSNKQLRVRRELLRNAMEIAVQSSLSHPNIVQFYSTFNNVVLRCRQGHNSSQMLGVNPRCLYLEAAPPASERADDGAPVTCILAEYCDAGSLATALQLRAFPRLARRASLTPFMYDMKGIYMTLLDVALALRHLHSLNLVHRDVKSANLLLKSNPRDYRGFTVKLADFGFVLHLAETAEDGNRYAVVDQACGTVTHMAPECMPGKAKIDTAVDVYSFGVLMWELLAGGARPYSNINLERIPRLVYRGARPTFASDVPQAYQRLANHCWRSNPARRPRSGELVTAMTALLGAM